MTSAVVAPAPPPRRWGPEGKRAPGGRGPFECGLGPPPLGGGWRGGGWNVVWVVYVYVYRSAVTGEPGGGWSDEVVEPSHQLIGQ